MPAYYLRMRRLSASSDYMTLCQGMQDIARRVMRAKSHEEYNRIGISHRVLIGYIIANTCT